MIHFEHISVRRSYLVSSHTVSRSQGGVSTTLAVSAGDTDSRAGSSDNLKTLVEGSLVDLKALHTSTHLDSLASVVLVRPVLELNVLEIVSPEAEGTRAGALSVEVMASVACIDVSSSPSSNSQSEHTDDQANVVLLSEVNACGDVGRALNPDGVVDV